MTRLLWVVVAIVGAVGFLGTRARHDPGPKALPTYVAESTRLMAERLQKLAEEYESRDRGARPYFSANSPWNIPAYRDELRRASDVEEVMNLRFDLMQELLWDGRTEEAVAELHALEAMRPQLTSDQARNMAHVLRLFWITAYLRIGEERNCLARHANDSCLLPIRGDGVHADRGGSQAAIQQILAALSESPDDLAARWLLNIAHMNLGDWPEAVPERWRIGPEAFASEHDIGRFPNVGPQSGTGILGLAGGSVLEDFDGDGRLDVVASSWGFRDPLRFLRNQGDGTFEDRTAAAGLTGEVGGLNLSHADYNNDGHPGRLR
ncbi:MAG: FG-GAP-like repeat-containing protein [Vicinamibacteria bacterium]